MTNIALSISESVNGGTHPFRPTRWERVLIALAAALQWIARKCIRLSRRIDPRPLVFMVGDSHMHVGG